MRGLPFTELTIVDARAVAVSLVVAGVTAVGAAASAASKLALHAEGGHLEGRVGRATLLGEEGRGGTWGEGTQARRGARREGKRSGERIWRGPGVIQVISAQWKGHKWHHGSSLT